MRPSLLISSEAEVSQKALGDAVSTSMVMWFVIFLAALLVVILVAVSQAPPGAERERTPARPKAARPATARPRQTRTAPPFRSGSPPQGGLPARRTGGRPGARRRTTGCRCPGTCHRGAARDAAGRRGPAATRAVPAGGPMFPSALPAAPVAVGRGPGGEPGVRAAVPAGPAAHIGAGPGHGPPGRCRRTGAGVRGAAPFPAGRRPGRTRRRRAGSASRRRRWPAGHRGSPRPSHPRPVSQVPRAAAAG